MTVYSQHLSPDSASLSPDVESPISFTSSPINTLSSASFFTQDQPLSNSSTDYQLWLRPTESVRIRIKAARRFEQQKISRAGDLECGCCDCHDMASEASWSGASDAEEDGITEDSIPVASPSNSKKNKDDGSWTLVTSKRKRTLAKRGKKSKKIASKGHSHKQDLDNSTPPPPSPGSIKRAIRRTATSFTKISSALKIDSDKLSQLIYHARQRVHKLEIKKAVIIGLGNLDDETDRHPLRAAQQLALFLAIIKAVSPSGQIKDIKADAFKTEDVEHRKLLQVLNTMNLPCYAQDPAFTLTDAAILDLMNIKSVNDTEGTDMITEDTLVFAPFVDVTVLMPEILKGKKPAMYVGVDFDTIDDTIGTEAKVYAEHVDGDVELVEETMEVLQEYLKSMVNVDIDLNPLDGTELSGLTMWVRK